MGTGRNDLYDYDDGLTKAQRREIRLRRRRRQVLMLRIFTGIAAVVVIALSAVLATYLIRKNAALKSPLSGKEAVTAAGSGSVSGNDEAPAASADQPAMTAEEGASKEAVSGQDAEVSASQDNPDGETAQSGTPQAPSASSAEVTASGQELLDQAAFLAAGYDYDGAVSLLKSADGYEGNAAFVQAVSDYEAARERCVAVDVNTVPHIFYHSLVNDPGRAFNTETLGQFTVDGMNAWMTTVEEFDKITQQLYDNGYVYVRLRDLVVETTGEDGQVHFEPNTHLMLPPEKKAIVLSVDDLSYYHSYKPAGFPEKLVLDENGLVKCRYETADGNIEIGDFDVVPRLNTFLREHPDGSYHGARGLIALTGYNGVFGYRTDIDYEVREHLVDDQAQWLAEHPDFSRDKEIEEAKVIASAIRAEGWEFASHTWGHISVTGADAEKLRIDNEKWVNNVQNIVGPTDTIIFAHGNDIGDWQGYSADNEKYQYYRSVGYAFYCNVDGSVPYWVQIRSDYVRQGRINMDGYMLYQASTGQTDVLNNLIDAGSVFDERRPTPVVANGQG